VSTWAVPFVENGQRTSMSHLTEDSAKRFESLVELLGPERAREIASAPRRETQSKLSVDEWVRHHSAG
jgi:hypothetical protein